MAILDMDSRLSVISVKDYLFLDKMGVRDQDDLKDHLELAMADRRVQALQAVVYLVEIVRV